MGLGLQIRFVQLEKLHFALCLTSPLRPPGPAQKLSGQGPLLAGAHDRRGGGNTLDLRHRRPFPVDAREPLDLFCAFLEIL